MLAMQEVDQYDEFWARPYTTPLFSLTLRCQVGLGLSIFEVLSEINS